ncbi:MAG TPA: phosphotriesterase-related protein [Actinomycetota bacterium]|nr:phosphotriesterase-related protein [Actinomycetota bacterium]
MASIQTVLGPVDSSRLGVCLPHEHVFLNLMSEHGPDGRLNDLHLMTEELARFHALGGGALVELTSIGLGREPVMLRQVASATGLHIIMGTGYYRDPYLEHTELDAEGTNACADRLIGEVRDGIDGTDIHPGIIGEIGSGRTISPREERSLRAAARAHLATGLTISTHAAGWPVGLEQLNLLAEEGVTAGRVIIGHADTVPSTDYHEAIAARGAYVEFDNLQGVTEYDTQTVIRFILTLRSLGHLDRILLSHDICLRSQLSIYGGPAYSFLLKDFVPRLLAAGLSTREIEILTVENPAAAISGER